MLDFAIAHQALITGVVGSLVCVAVIVTVFSMGIVGVGIVAGAGTIAAGVGAGLFSSGLTFLGLKIAEKNSREQLVPAPRSFDRGC